MLKYTWWAKKTAHGRFSLQ